MIEMSHTEEDLKEAVLFANEEKQFINDASQKCNTALEILQNELINCEKNMSLEKSQREYDEKKLKCLEELEKNPKELVANEITLKESASQDDSIVSSVFSSDQCRELVDYVTRVANHFNGIENEDIRKIIFEYAELKKINHGFDIISRTIENKWYQGFLLSHPEMNSVLKKSDNNSIHSNENANEFRNQVVQKFLSDYEMLNRNSDSQGEKNVCATNEVTQSIATVCIDSKQPYFTSTSENFTYNGLNYTSMYVPNQKNDVHFNANSFHVKENCSHNDESSEKEPNGKSQNTLMLEDRNDCGVIEDNSTDSKMAKCISDSNKIPLDKSLVTTKHKENEHFLVGKSNALNSADPLCGQTSDIAFADLENPEFEAANHKDGVITDVTDLNNDEFINSKNSRNNDVLLPEYSGNQSNNEETSDLKDSSENSKKLEDNEISVGTDIALAKNADETTCVKEAQPLQESNLAAKPAVKFDKKNSKFFKKKQPSNKKKTKRSKYLYKLKSYTGSVFYFTSSTSVSFIKPVIKLTKLDEGSYKNVNSIITSSQNVDPLLTTNRDAVVKTDVNCGSDLSEEVDTETNCIADNDMEHQTEVQTSPTIGDDFRNCKADTDSGTINDTLTEGGKESNSYSNDYLRDRVDKENNVIADKDSKMEIEIETNPTEDSDLKGLVETGTCVTNNTSENQAEDERRCSTSNELKAELDVASGPSADNVMKAQSEVETIPNELEIEAVSSALNAQLEVETSLDAVHETSFRENDNLKNEVDTGISFTKNDVKTEMNPSTCHDLKNQVMTPENNTKVSTKKSSTKPSARSLKRNASDERITPTFSMQTRRKRLKFLPDGTLVTPNQRHQRFSEEFTSSSLSPRSESKSTRKKLLKTSPEVPKIENKMKTEFIPNTPKQRSRSTEPTKKVSRNPPDRYIPKPNGLSKKPQKIFDYDSYYREHFRETEVKLPPSCKKQMVALSRVTSVSPASESGGRCTVNPAQLLSCLLGMPITPDQICTIKFKPPIKHLKPKKQVNSSPAKLISSKTGTALTKQPTVPKWQPAT